MHLIIKKGDHTKCYQAFSRKHVLVGAVFSKAQQMVLRIYIEAHLEMFWDKRNIGFGAITRWVGGSN